MNILEIRKKIRPILLSIGFSVIGFAVAFVLKKFLHFELNRLEVSVIAFIITTASVLFLFPRVFKIPFGKVSVKDFIFKVGLYRPDNIFKYIIIGVISAIITLSGMMLASYQIGKYIPTLSTITLTQAVFSLTPGIWEEILFRGVIMIVLLRLTKSLKKAAVIQIILFGLVHIKGFDLISFVDAFSVLIMAISFTYITYKTKSLIPAIIFHYLHDTFLFFVQLPDGQYEGFSDNAIFYSFLWLSIAFTIIVIKKISERFKIQGGYDFYSIEGGIEISDISPAKTDRNEREIRRNKKILIFNAVGFSAILLSNIKESSLFLIIFNSLFVLTNLLLYIYLKKFEQNIRFHVSLLTSIVAFVTAYGYYKQGSENIYYIWILIGLVSIVVGFFRSRKKKAG